MPAKSTILSPHAKAVLQALLVTFLWSTSWVLVKRGLEDIPPLTFAGLRYTIAFLVLLPFAVRNRAQVAALRRLPRRGWVTLAVLGLVYYTITQGMQFVTLLHLEAVTFSLLLNFTAVIVAVAGIFTLHEIPRAHQWAGMVIFTGGVLLYFYPVVIPQGQGLGLALAGISVVANGVSSLLGRQQNRAGSLTPLTITVVTMGIGAVVMLAVGVIVQGMPRISLLNWGIVVWLAVVNSAVAFTLWNHTLRTLTATESSIINNTMLVQIAVLAWLFLGEQITPLEVVGLAVATAGIFIVQVRGKGTAPRD